MSLLFRTCSVTAILLLCITHSFAGIDSTRYLRNAYEEKAIKLVLGVHVQQFKDDLGNDRSRKLIEAGIQYSRTQDGGIHLPVALNHGPSLELALGDKTIYGFQYSGWVCASMFTFGIHTIYYTDFRRGNFKIRPELGLGFTAVRLTAGINIPTISNADFPELRKSLGHISLQVFIKAKTLSGRAL